MPPAPPGSTPSGSSGLGAWFDQPIACRASHSRCTATRSSPSYPAIQAVTFRLQESAGRRRLPQATFSRTRSSGCRTDGRVPLCRAGRLAPLPRAGCSGPEAARFQRGARVASPDASTILGLRQQPDRLVVPRRASVLARPVPLLQLRDAQVIRHTRHHRLARFLAIQLDCFAAPAESAESDVLAAAANSTHRSISSMSRDAGRIRPALHRRSTITWIVGRRHTGGERCCVVRRRPAAEDSARPLRDVGVPAGYIRSGAGRKVTARYCAFASAIGLIFVATASRARMLAFAQLDGAAALAKASHM